MAQNGGLDILGESPKLEAPSEPEKKKEINS